MQRAYANLPLHSGRAPRWLFTRMTRLAGALTEGLVMEWGPHGFLARIAVAAEAAPARTAAATVSRLPPEALLREVRRALAQAPHLDLPARHGIQRSDIHPDRLAQTFLRTYDTTATILERAVQAAQLGQRESLDALRRLEQYWNRLDTPAPQRLCSPASAE